VDASLVVKWVTDEVGSDKALAWLNAHSDEELIAPAFMPAEVASVIRRKSLRGETTMDQGLKALHFLTSLNIKLAWDWALAEKALSLAAELDQPSTYDTAYLALAERERCDLWTADAEFVGAASARYPFVRLV
jgi:predicted nucleic acid-binding protein